MKKKFLIPVFLFFLGGLSFAYQQQGFDNYNELNGLLNFQCSSQCSILIGPIIENDYININGYIQGNGIILYGFLIGDQVYPGESIQINGGGNIEQKFILSKSPTYTQVPKEAQLILLFQGAIKGDKVSINGGILGITDNFINGFNQALEYKPYNPRTINFLEGPLRNGKYINQAFFSTILILLGLAFLYYIFSGKKESKRKATFLGIGIIIFFWVFFDFFSTVNELRVYKDIMDAPNIMENGRVGKDSDFYQFLDFIKTQVPKKEKGFFIAPYPFDFEGKYHIYPDVKFGSITGVNYIFFYNIYGLNNGFGFMDPSYNSGILEWNNFKFNVQKEIVWKPYAKIYILNK